MEVSLIRKYFNRISCVVNEVCVGVVVVFLAFYVEDLHDAVELW